MPLTGVLDMGAEMISTSWDRIVACYASGDVAVTSIK